MKNSVILLLLLLVSNQMLFAQHEQKLSPHHRAVYKMTYQTDQHNVQMKDMFMELLLGEEFSLFRSIAKAQEDSLRYVELNDPTNYQEGLPRLTLIGGAMVDNYQILKTGKAITTYENLTIIRANDNNYVYEEPILTDLWQVGEQTKDINGYQCQVAYLNFSGRHWVAWFALEVPISEGPYKFSGLPGLIISIQDSTESWKFELVELSKTSRQVPFNFDKKISYKKIEKVKFFKLKDQLLDNWLDLRVAANKSNPSALQRKRFLENRKEDNNRIEVNP